MTASEVFEMQAESYKKLIETINSNFVLWGKIKDAVLWTLIFQIVMFATILFLLIEKNI